jgi:hypothetical protein
MPSIEQLQANCQKTYQKLIKCHRNFAMAVKKAEIDHSKLSVAFSDIHVANAKLIVAMEANKAKNIKKQAELKYIEGQRLDRVYLLCLLEEELKAIQADATIIENVKLDLVEANNFDASSKSNETSLCKLQQELETLKTLGTIQAEAVVTENVKPNPVVAAESFDADSQDTPFADANASSFGDFEAANESDKVDNPVPSGSVKTEENEGAEEESVEANDKDDAANAKEENDKAEGKNTDGKGEVCSTDADGVALGEDAYAKVIAGSPVPSDFRQALFNKSDGTNDNKDDAASESDEADGEGDVAEPQETGKGNTSAQTELDQETSEGNTGDQTKPIRLTGVVHGDYFEIKKTGEGNTGAQTGDDENNAESAQTKGSDNAASEGDAAAHDDESAETDGNGTSENEGNDGESRQAEENAEKNGNVAANEEATTENGETDQSEKTNGKADVAFVDDNVISYLKGAEEESVEANGKDDAASENDDTAADEENDKAEGKNTDGKGEVCSTDADGVVLGELSGRALISGTDGDVESVEANGKDADESFLNVAFLAFQVWVLSHFAEEDELVLRQTLRQAFIEQWPEDETLLAHTKFELNFIDSVKFVAVANEQNLAYCLTLSLDSTGNISQSNWQRQAFEDATSASATAQQWLAGSNDFEAEENADKNGNVAANEEATTENGEADESTNGKADVAFVDDNVVSYLKPFLSTDFNVEVETALRQAIRQVFIKQWPSENLLLSHAVIKINAVDFVRFVAVAIDTQNTVYCLRLSVDNAGNVCDFRSERQTFEDVTSASATALKWLNGISFQAEDVEARDNSDCADGKGDGIVKESENADGKGNDDSTVKESGEADGKGQSADNDETDDESSEANAKKSNGTQDDEAVDESSCYDIGLQVKRFINAEPNEQQPKKLDEAIRHDFIKQWPQDEMLLKNAVLEFKVQQPRIGTYRCAATILSEQNEAKPFVVHCKCYTVNENGELLSATKDKRSYVRATSAHNKIHNYLNKS